MLKSLFNNGFFVESAELLRTPKLDFCERLPANSARFFITSLLKNPADGCFCINTRSINFLTMTFRPLKNDVIHNFTLSFFSA